MPEAVEVPAVGARVGEHAVEHDADAAVRRGRTELFEVRVRAEDGIDLAVIAGVVPVVGSALENRVEIQHRHAELPQVVQPVGDAAQGAAVEIDGGVFALRRVGLPLDGFVPVGVVVHGLAHAAVVLHAALRGGGAVAREAVGEDLIHHAGAKPRRGRESGAIDRQAPAVTRCVAQPGVPAVRRGAQPADAAVVAREPEAVAQRLRRGGHGHGRFKAGGRLRHGDGVAVRIAVELHGGVEHERLRVREGEAHGRTGLERADRAAEGLVGRVVLRRGVLRQQEQIQVRVVLGRAREAEVLRHGLPLHAAVGVMIVVIERERAADRVRQLVGVEVGKREAGALAGEPVIRLHAVAQAAGLAHDRQRAVTHGDHLRQAARLEARRHEQKIAARVHAVRQRLVVADVGAQAALVPPLGAAHKVLIFGVARAEEHERHVLAVHELVEHALHQVEALLRRHARDHGDDGRVRADLETELPAQRGAAGGLAARVVGGVGRGDAAVVRGVKDGGVDAVEDAGQLVLPGVENALESLAVSRRADLTGVARADGVDVVGKDAAGLEQVRAAVELHEFRRIIARIDAEQILHEFEGELALIGDVVDGQQRLHARLHSAGVLRFHQHGQHGRVPVVAVQDLGRKVQPGQRLQDRAGEKRILLALGLAAEVDAVAEIKLVVHKVDDDTVEQQPLDADVLVPPAKVDIKIRQVRDLGCVFFLDHAVVRRDDACVKAERGQTFRQCADDVRKAAGLGQRRALGGCQQHAGQVAAAFLGQRCAQFGFHGIPSFTGS